MGLFTWTFFLGYILLLSYFALVDTYHHAFFTPGLTVICYNLVRLLFIVYLIWLFYALGDLILNRLNSQWYRDPFTLQSALLGFFAGVGVWHILLFFLGFAGLYTRPAMMAATLVVFAASLPRMNQWISHLRIHPFSNNWGALLILIVPFGVFLITKGLYPAGGHDYYNHYFHYYRTVTETGSLLPNAVWYHFYYSKGAGLFFLSMLLTDPLAPQLATTAFLLAGASIIFSMVKPSASWRLLPWIGAALYFALLIYTPGPLQNMHQGGWGDLEKPHEPAAVLMLALIWLTIGLATTTLYRVWGITLLLTISALILISPNMAIFAGVYMGMAALYFFVARNKKAAYWAMGATFVAALWFIALLLLNYLLTGLPDDQTLFIFWPLIHFNKVKEWGILFELLIIHWLKTKLVAQQVHFNRLFLVKLLTYLRIDIWWPLFCLASCLLTWQWWQRSLRKVVDNPALYACGGFLLIVVLFAMFIGRDQSISFYRFTSFTYAPMLCLCLLLLSPVLQHRIAKILLFCCVFIILINNFHGGNMGRIIKHGARFASGRYSIADAYRHQRGWPGRMPWGGIYPAAETVWLQLPHQMRIWSMHIHSYCMLPDCHMESYLSYRFSPHAEAIYFGEPSKAKTWLQKEGLNYFFFSNVLELTDPLPRSPLFSPNHIANYFGIAWTDGNNTLLTWKEQAQLPIDSTWLNRYQQAVNRSTSVKSFPYDSMRTVMEMERKKSKLLSFDLPWAKNK